MTSWKLRPGALTHALDQFTATHRGTYYHVFPDTTAIRFGEDILAALQSKRYPNLVWSFTEDVRMELSFLAESKDAALAQMARSLLHAIPSWRQGRYSCSVQDPAAAFPSRVQSLYDLFRQCPLDRCLFIFGSLVPFCEFAKLHPRTPGSAFVLNRSSFENDSPAKVYIAQLHQLRPPALQASVAMGRALPAYSELELCWRDGSTTLVSVNKLGKPLFHGGEGGIYRLPAESVCPGLREPVLLKLYFNARADLCGELRARCLLSQSVERVSFPLAVARPITASYARPIAGFVLPLLSGDTLNKISFSQIGPALRSLVCKLLELRLSDFYMQDLSAKNIAYDPQLGCALFDLDGGQLRVCPAISSRQDQSHPFVQSHELVTPGLQSFLEGSFLLHCLLSDHLDSPAFLRDPSGVRAFEHTVNDALWPRAIPFSARTAWLDELNSSHPPLRSLGEWLIRLQPFW